MKRLSAPEDAELKSKLRTAEEGLVKANQDLETMRKEKTVEIKNLTQQIETLRAQTSEHT